MKKFYVFLTVCLAALLLCGCHTPLSETAKYAGGEVTVTYSIRTNISYPEHCPDVHFADGYAKYSTSADGEEEAWNFIDTEGKKVFSRDYSEITLISYSGEAAIREADGKTYVIDVDGGRERCTTWKFDDYAALFDTAKSNLLDSTPLPEGALLVSRSYEGLAVFAVVAEEEKDGNNCLLGFCDEEGKAVIPPFIPCRMDAESYFLSMYEDRVVINDGGRMGIVEISRRPTVQPTPRPASGEGLTATGESGGKKVTLTYVLDTDIYHPWQLGSAMYFQNGYATLFHHHDEDNNDFHDTGTLCGGENLMDTEGKLLFDLEYERLTVFAEDGYAAAQTNSGQYVLVDRNGEEKLSSEQEYWERARALEDLAFGGKYPDIDPEHKRVVSLPENGFSVYAVKSPERMGYNSYLLGLLDADGQVVIEPFIPCSIDYYLYLREGYTIINDNGYIGILQLKIEE